ncbi:tetratricopeptide repeat protein [Streptomyces sp. NPDC005962]|uniref:tetratricopeptide repeat protein n=1 Tax=Streptomyces sp. NPDC005962 TaxID=3154466 RepID=UPI0033C34D04
MGSELKSVSVTETGDARAQGGGTATTGYHGPVPNADGLLPTASAEIRHTGNASAAAGSIANTGYMAIGTLNITSSGSREPVTWPARVGVPPVTASAFQPRNEVRGRINCALQSRNTVVLSGGGGVGKSQIVAAYAREALTEGIDFVLWAGAADPEQVMAVYAQAAYRIHVPGAHGQDVESDARALLDWLATTTRSWLLILDDISDPHAMAPWWPPSSPTETGRVLATTRRREAALSGGNRSVVHVDTFTKSEAVAYLHDRLTVEDAAPLMDDQVGPVIEELGRLPLALSHAAAYVINEAVSCTEYLRRVNDQESRLDLLLPRQADTEGYGRPVAAALLLSLDAANSSHPVGLAIPALRLAAFLDPAGHPRSLWGTTALAEYLAERRAETSGPTPAVTADDAQAVLRQLHRYGLLTDESDGDPRLVRLHALTARAARETIPVPELAGIVIAAAYAVLELWPEEDHNAPDLGAVLRANVEVMSACLGVPRWSSIVHPLLFRHGDSLLQAGLYPAALRYWRRLSINYQRLLGKKDFVTLAVRGREATANWRTGNIDEAIAIQKHVAAQYKRRKGAKHQDTLNALVNLAIYYRNAGRGGDAIALLNRVIRRDNALAADNPSTLNLGNNLAAAYGNAGFFGEAINLLEVVVAQSAEVLGDKHPATLLARSNLGVNYWRATRVDEAIQLLEPTVAEFEAVLGADHPETLNACSNLGMVYHFVGNLAQAIRCEEKIADSRERSVGAHHADTLQAQELLATSYGIAGRIDDAIRLQKQVVAAHAGSRTADPSDYLRSSGNLAVIYRQVGCTSEAIEIQEMIVASAEEVFGRGQPISLAARGNLATSYWQAGRVDEAIDLEERVAQECEQLLGVGDPQTINAYGNLAVSYMQADRIVEAEEILDRFGLSLD